MKQLRLYDVKMNVDYCFFFYLFFFLQVLLEKPNVVLCLAHVVMQYWSAILCSSDGFLVVVEVLVIFGLI